MQKKLINWQQTSPMFDIEKTSTMFFVCSGREKLRKEVSVPLNGNARGQGAVSAFNTCLRIALHCVPHQ